MRINSVRRIRRVSTAATTVAALTFAGIGVIGGGSAYASAKGVSGGSDPEFTATYTCDTLTSLGANIDVPGAIGLEGTGNCVASNGAPVPPTPNFIGVTISLVGRSDGTVYHCYNGYDAPIFVNLPTIVGALACVPAS